MLLEVDDLKWSEFISIYVEKSLFVNPAWLAITASSFKFGLKYYIWKQDGTEIIGFPIFYKGITIKAPTNFHTFSLVRAQGTQEQQKKAFVNALQQLKHQFKVVKLKTEIDFPYLKELESVGFCINEKFTYLKRLDELNYSRNISRMIKKSSQKKYTLSSSVSFSSAFSKIWSSNKKYLFGNQKNFFNFFSALVEGAFSQVFDLHQDGIHIASLVVIQNQNQKIVYTYLISVPDKKQHPEAQVLLYNYCMAHYKNKGYLFCDLCGANLPSVAKFKAKFNADLKSYSYVVYNSGYFSKIGEYFKKLILKW